MQHTERSQSDCVPDSSCKPRLKDLTLEERAIEIANQIPSRVWKDVFFVKLKNPPRLATSGSEYTELGEASSSW